MVNLSVEEPDALVRARPGLWEPWVGNCPGPPGPPQVRLTKLSMGMSDDFEIAIREGATIVRVGSLLFEGIVSG